MLAFLRRLPVEFDLRALSFEEGLRAGLSIAALVLADDLFGAPILLEAALGALLTCLCDSGGLVRRRAPALLVFGVLGAAMTGGLALARPLGYPLIPIAALGIFAFSFIRIYGQAALQVGNLLSVVLVLSLDRSLHDWRRAALLAGVFLGGSLWALLLTMVIWRLHPNRPARQAVARVYLGLAALCDDLRGLLAREAVDEPVWERHAREHRRRVRELIEKARTAVAERLRSGGAAVRPATQTLLRLESADQMFRALIALTERLETEPGAEVRHAAYGMAARIGAILRELAPRVVADTDRGLAALGAEIDAIGAAGLPGDLGRIANLLTERLRATLILTGTLTSDVGLGAPTAGVTLLAETLRANLNLQSVALRHAARAGLVSAAGLAITFTWPASYEHWLTITLVLTLQPYYALTLQRALERIGGTVLGGLVAAGLSLLCRTPLEIAGAILPLSMLALSLRAVNFGLYVTALTPLIVLLVELGHAGQGHFTVALMRAMYTVIGGGLAVLGCIFLWPSWEPDRLRLELREALRCHARYADRELALLLGEVGAEAVDAARRAAGMASNNLEASLSRAMLEPRASRDRLEVATVVDAALRRVAGRLSALQMEGTVQDAADRQSLGPWRVWIAEAVGRMEQDMVGESPERPAVMPDNPHVRESLGRIARQLELAAAALRRDGDLQP